MLIFELLGPPVTVAPVKARKKFLKKFMPLILMILNKNNDKRKIKK